MAASLKTILGSRPLNSAKNKRRYVMSREYVSLRHPHRQLENRVIQEAIMIAPLQISVPPRANSV